MTVPRKQRGKIADLPYALRLKVCEKIRDNKSMRDVAEWLFGVTDPADGLPLSVKWTVDQPNREAALRNCAANLYAYRKAPECQAFLVQDKQTGVIGGMMSHLRSTVESSGSLDAAEVVSGSTQVALSATMEMLEELAKGKPTPAEIDTLSLALARLNRTLIAQTNSATAAGNSKINADRAEISREAMQLAREKFQFNATQACLAHADQVKSIAGSTSTNDEKIEQLGRVMFGEDWRK